MDKMHGKDNRRHSRLLNPINKYSFGFFVGLMCCLTSFSFAQDNTSSKNLAMANKKGVELVVLGVAQDAGYPQLNCYRAHCMPGWQDYQLRRHATSLAVIDHQHKQKFLFEATPDIRQQMYWLNQVAPDDTYQLDGIFLTHAHMGHYAGLIHLGREAAGTKNVPVYVMPRMRKYLEDNGPWSQLVSLKNIVLRPLKSSREQQLNQRLRVTPLLVPHRDEYSETVGYHIQGPNKSALFIPDIDKWQKWDSSIVEWVKKVDYALLDATFFANGELPNRDMSEVPHPFVEESMKLFESLSSGDKNKIIFIHFNHTNPLIKDGSKAQKQVLEAGFDFATEGMMLSL